MNFNRSDIIFIGIVAAIGTVIGHVIAPYNLGAIGGLGIGALVGIIAIVTAPAAPTLHNRSKSWCGSCGFHHSNLSAEFAARVQCSRDRRSV